MIGPIHQLNQTALESWAETMRTLDDLTRAIEAEARREPFPIDEPVYDKAGRDPLVPILFAGNLEAPVAILGRDLGKDEVAVGQPLVGAGGRLVRSGLFESRFGEPPPKSDRRVEAALELAVLTNTVPYKPPGNKAYSNSVKERFRPLLAEFLCRHWRGSIVLTLGTEAFRWFDPYSGPGEADAFWAGDDRYEADFACEIGSGEGPGRVSKALTIRPLPHPSPLNQRWYKAFPGLLSARLTSVRP